MLLSSQSFTNSLRLGDRHNSQARPRPVQILCVELFLVAQVTDHVLDGAEHGALMAAQGALKAAQAIEANVMKGVEYTALQSANVLLFAAQNVSCLFPLLVPLTPPFCSMGIVVIPLCQHVSNLSSPYHTWHALYDACTRPR